jgi:murein DD-endopeptidase MepM/ murein hydrolase activator NlpD
MTSTDQYTTTGDRFKLLLFHQISAGLLLAYCAAKANDSITFDAGGGPPARPVSDCISSAERNQVQLNLSRNLTPSRGPHPLDSTPALYPFVPIAGTEWQDRFVNNFVDLDPTSGILDWDCTDFTYDGHQGHDIVLRSFGEQDAGVPVFAALDGTVSDAHDGEYDRNTVWNGQPANYVILQHSGTHYSYYWHMRSNSVAVAVGQFVPAGTQLGLAASSGQSDWPHLHFESHFNGAVYEPSAGPCRAGASDWVSQISIRRDMYIEEFSMHNTNSFPSEAWLPNNPVRTGTFVRTGASQPIGAWYTLHNQPSNSTWRARFLRPSGTVLYDSGTLSYGNPFYRWSNWWFWFGLNPDVAGAWTLEFSINGQVMLRAPFTVLDSGGLPTNRPPNSVIASFDPLSPRTNDVIFCRLNVPLAADPDYDLVRFRYEWRTNGILVRDTTNAAFADALPAVAAAQPTVLSCTVTPYDGTAFGISNIVQTVVGPPIQLKIAATAPNLVSLHWPVSGVPYVPEGATNLSASWVSLTNYINQSSGENVTTSTVSGESHYFRLRWP